MALTAQAVIQRVVDTLQDPTSIRWPVDELIRYLNDGQRQIILHRPDASSKTATLAMVAGTKQTLPADGAKLLSVIANTGSTKRGVTLVRDRKILDVTVPGWHSLTGSDEILHYLYDEREPRTFYVYPPATVAASLDIAYSCYPADVAAAGAGTLYTAVVGNINVPDIYGNALHDYVCYRAYMKDAEFAANAQLAQSHMASFAAALGVELQAALRASPRASTESAEARSS